MIIDSHVHIGGPPAEAEPDEFVKLMEKCKIDKVIAFRYFYNQPTFTSNKFKVRRRETPQTLHRICLD